MPQKVFEEGGTMPACNVITIALSTGAGAEGIGQGAAQRLGFRCVQDEIIVRAAEQAGVAPAEVGQVEHSRSTITRILDSLARIADGADPAALVDPNIHPNNPSRLYEGLIQDVIRDAAEAGQVVITAHGTGEAADRARRSRATGLPATLLRHQAGVADPLRPRRQYGHPLSRHRQRGDRRRGTGDGLT